MSEPNAVPAKKPRRRSAKAVQDLAIPDVNGAAADGIRSKPHAIDARGRTPARAMRTLNRLYDSWYQPIFRTHGITIPYWITLRVLSDCTVINQLELARRASMLPTSIVAVLDALEKRGLITRKRDPADRRQHQVAITPRGEQMVLVLKPHIYEGLEKSISGITDLEIEAFWHVILKIESNLSEMLSLDVID